jgi:hypothetical protein
LRRKVKFPEVAGGRKPRGVRIAFYFLARAVEVYASQNFSRWRNRSDRQKAWTATPRVGYEVFRYVRNARIRLEGTKNLVEAALEVGARWLITQSIAWAYAPGPQPYSENDPLDLDAEGTRSVTVGGVATL